MGSNVFGMFVAGLAVVSSGMQQIYVGTMQAKHKLNANELLSNTAPAQVEALALLQSLRRCPDGLHRDALLAETSASTDRHLASLEPGLLALAGALSHAGMWSSIEHFVSPVITSM